LRLLVALACLGLVGVSVAIALYASKPWASDHPSLIDRLAICDSLYTTGSGLVPCGKAARENVDKWECYEKYAGKQLARLECLKQAGP
jgi:hypothetical protein